MEGALAFLTSRRPGLCSHGKPRRTALFRFEQPFPDSVEPGMRGQECLCTRLLERKREASRQVGDMPSLAGRSVSTLSPRCSKHEACLPWVGSCFTMAKPAVFRSRHGVGVVTRVLGQRPGSAAMMGQSPSTTPPKETSNGKYLHHQAVCCRLDHCLGSGHDLRGSALLL